MNLSKSQIKILQAEIKKIGRTVWKKGTKYTTKVRGIITDVRVDEKRLPFGEVLLEYDVQFDDYPEKVFKCGNKFFEE